MTQLLEKALAQVRAIPGTWQFRGNPGDTTLKAVPGDAVPPSYGIKYLYCNRFSLGGKRCEGGRRLVDRRQA
jgi:hypothetical protein